MASGKNGGLFIRRKTGPTRSLRGRLIIFEQGQLSGSQIILEAELLCLGFFFLGLLRFFAFFDVFLVLVLLYGRFFFLLGLLFLGFFLSDVAGLDDALGRCHVDILLDFELELDGRIFFDEFDARDGQVLGIVGSQDDLGQHGGHLGIVINRRFRPADEIDDGVRFALAGLVAIPESIAEFEPMR